MSIYNKLNTQKIPSHIAIIMDGNGRWAKEKGKKRSFGHIEGVKTVGKIVNTAIKLNIRYITLFAFSKENWDRPKNEVELLMNLFISTIKDNQKNKNNLLEKNVKINTIGCMEDLPKKCQIALNKLIQATKNNTGLVLTLALSYSSKHEITQAVKQIFTNETISSKDMITEALIEKNLQTSNLPDPELLIRTSGEQRISNFLLWQIAFSELYFSEKKWPDFNEEELYMAIFEYQKRERRFGKTTEQLNNE
tara:strand:+ start:750 stop:1499 length:750 start_codon:yes stop_codon:yes gene_type:complete